MKPVDPTAELLRLGEHSGSELTSALRALSDRGPDAAELASLATRLSLQGIAMTPAAAPTPAIGASSGVRWKLALLGTAALSGLGGWLFLRAPTAPGSLSPSQAKVGIAQVSQPDSGSGERSAPDDRGRAAAPVTAAPPASLGPAALEPALQPKLASSPEASPSAAAARVTVSDSPGVTEALPRNGALSKSKLGVAADVAANGAETPTDVALPSELELLRGARLALKGSPAEALRLVEQHRAVYPSGKMTQERELIAISALVALGRRTAALSRASNFERAFPTSPYRKQIGELLQ